MDCRPCSSTICERERETGLQEFKMEILEWSVGMKIEMQYMEEREASILIKREREGSEGTIGLFLLPLNKQENHPSDPRS